MIDHRSYTNNLSSCEITIKTENQTHFFYMHSFDFFKMSSLRPVWYVEEMELVANSWRYEKHLYD